MFPKRTSFVSRFISPPVTGRGARVAVRDRQPGFPHMRPAGNKQAKCRLFWRDGTLKSFNHSCTGD